MLKRLGDKVKDIYSEDLCVQKFLCWGNEDDCLVVGDSENDMKMFSNYKHSILIGKESGLMEQVEFVSKSADEDGIYFALQQYMLI